MHEDQEEHVHDEPVKEPKQQDERGYTEMTDGEMQVSLSVHKAIDATLAEANAILEGRYKSIAITHLETALMFFNKAIAVDGIK